MVTNPAVAPPEECPAGEAAGGAWGRPMCYGMHSVLNSFDKLLLSVMHTHHSVSICTWWRGRRTLRRCPGTPAPAAPASSALGPPAPHPPPASSALGPSWTCWGKWSRHVPSLAASSFTCHRSVTHLSRSSSSVRHGNPRCIKIY